MATNNQYENLENDDLDEYSDYTKPWKVDYAATNKFYGKTNWNTKKKKSRKLI